MNRPERLTIIEPQNKIKDIEGQLKSGILLEVSVLTNVPIKGSYSLTYKVDYGRMQSKWSEQIQK